MITPIEGRDNPVVTIPSANARQTFISVIQLDACAVNCTCCGTRFTLTTKADLGTVAVDAVVTIDVAKAQASVNSFVTRQVGARIRAYLAAERRIAFFHAVAE